MISRQKFDKAFKEQVVSHIMSGEPTKLFIETKDIRKIYTPMPLDFLF